VKGGVGGLWKKKNFFSYLKLKTPLPPLLKSSFFFFLAKVNEKIRF